MTKTIMLGEEDITRYLGPEPRRNQKISEALRKEIIEAGQILKPEVVYFEDLKDKLAQEDYPKLDLSFLEQSVQIPYKEQPLQVPRFCVYPAEGENEFGFKIKTSGVTYSYDIEIDFLTRPEIAHQIKIPLLKSTGLINNVPKSWSYRYQSDKSRIDKKAMKLRLDGSPMFQDEHWIGSYLNVLIPLEVKEQIKSAKTAFDSGLMFIAEKKPSEWNQRMIITRTPVIMIGFRNDQSYLISNFNLPKKSDELGVVA